MNLVKKCVVCSPIVAIIRYSVACSFFLHMYKRIHVLLSSWAIHIILHAIIAIYIYSMIEK